MKHRTREDARDAILTERPGHRATFLTVRVTSTWRGLMIEGELAAHRADGSRQAGPRVRDSYAFSRPLSPSELLAFVAWWSEARCDMLPERPKIEPGLPVPLERIAAEQPGSLPGEGKGRGPVRSHRSDRKADPIKRR